MVYIFGVDSKLLERIRLEREQRGGCGPGREDVIRWNLGVPENARGVVLFAHGSGSGRHSRRNRYVAEELRLARLGTLLIDLLTPEEEEIDSRTRHLTFDIGLLTERLAGITDWLKRDPNTRNLRVGYFGASTGAGAALVAAAERHEEVGAIVSRGGRPDLAGDSGGKRCSRDRDEPGSDGADARREETRDRLGSDTPVRRTRGVGRGRPARR